jgi:hypothetical protein
LYRNLKFPDASVHIEEYREQKFGRIRLLVGGVLGRQVPLALAPHSRWRRKPKRDD